MLGTLFGIGVGPGDADLLTLKAVKALKLVEHVFAAASTKNDYSLALDIVRDHLPPNTPLDHLAFPMTFDPDHLGGCLAGELRKGDRDPEAGKARSLPHLG